MKKRIIKLIALFAISTTLLTCVTPVFATADKATKTTTENVSDTKENEENIYGKWYGNSMNVSIFFEIKKDGTYDMQYANGPKAQGAWVLNKNVITLNKDTPNAMDLTYDKKEDTLTALMYEGEKCVFTKDEKNAEPEVSKDKKIEDTDEFDGIWKCEKVRIGKGSIKVLNVKLPIKVLDLDYMFLNIKDKSMNITAKHKATQDININDLALEFNDNSLILDVSKYISKEDLHKAAGETASNADINSIYDSKCLFKLTESESDKETAEFLLSLDNIDAAFMFEKTTAEEMNQIIENAEQ